LIAVAILDGEVTPIQYESDRIQRADVQQLLGRVSVHATSAYSQRFPREMPARVAIRLHDGRTLSREATEYPGLNGPPATWEDVLRKFRRLSGGRLGLDECDAIVEVVQDLERHPVARLTRLLTEVRLPADGPTPEDSRTREECSHGSHA
jgi:2-methylcitrate dehydratase